MIMVVVGRGVRRYGMSPVGEDELWARWRAGESLRKIAAAQSMPDQHVRRYLMQCGGIRPAPVRRAELHLSSGEREEVSRALARGESYRLVGRALGRSHTTISREVARNGGRAAYRAGPADEAAYVRARRPKVSKLARDPQLRAAVEAGLEAQWSPEQISARLRVDHPGDASMRICRESIYRAIFQPQRKAIKAHLHRQLRTARLGAPPARGGMRHPRIAAVPTGTGQIRAMVGIGARPPEVEERVVPGHWEGDLVMRTRPSAVATLVERTTRYLRVVALPGGIKAGPVRQALSADLAGVQAHLLRSITWDRGREMAEHATLTAQVGAPVYFSASTCPRTLTCASMTSTPWTPSPRASTPAHDESSDGPPPPRPTTS